MSTLFLNGPLTLVLSLQYVNRNVKTTFKFIVKLYLLLLVYNYILKNYELRSLRGLLNDCGLRTEVDQRKTKKQLLLKKLLARAQIQSWSWNLDVLFKIIQNNISQLFIFLQ